MSGGWNLSQLPVDLHSIWGVKILMGCRIISQHFFFFALLPSKWSQDIFQSILYLTALFPFFNILFALFPFFLLNTKHFDKSPPTSLGSICPSVFCLFSDHNLPLSIFSSLSLQLYYSLLSCLRHFRQAERRMTVLKQQKDECVLKEEKTRQYMGAVLAAAEHISKERDQLLQMVPLVLLLHGHRTHRPRTSMSLIYMAIWERVQRK